MPSEKCIYFSCVIDLVINSFLSVSPQSWVVKADSEYFSSFI